MPAQQQFSILLVDDDPTVVRVLNRILREFSPIRFASCGRDALKLARESVPDLVLLDVNMPEMSGFDVCQAFKLDPMLAQVPIIFVTNHEAAEIQAKALQLGAADFISKPPQESVVQARVRTFQRIKMLSDTLQRAVAMDFITGATNRQQMQLSLQLEWRRALRARSRLALLLAEIDGFAAYTAEFGEESGDMCLKAVADALRTAANRPADVLGRQSAGRFAMLLPDTDAKGASIVAARAIEAVKALDIPHGSVSLAGRITLSVGCGLSDFSRQANADGTTGFSGRMSSLADSGGDSLMTAAEQALAVARSELGLGARYVDVTSVGSPDLQAP